VNALRRLALAGAIGERRASEAVADMARVRLVRYPHAPLRERVWELRAQLTACDATYLALAEAFDGSTLMTSDRGLAERATDSLGSPRVVCVG
jgi:predicted nucleic acid-binding protein